MWIKTITFEKKFQNSNTFFTHLHNFISSILKPAFTLPQIDPKIYLNNVFKIVFVTFSFHFESICQKDEKEYRKKVERMEKYEKVGIKLSSEDSDMICV